MKSKVFFVNNVIFDGGISTNSKLIYLYLCKCANSDGQCFPSHNTIGTACGISVTTVKKAHSELEIAELIETQGQKRPNKGTCTNLYTVFNDRTGGYFKAPYFIFDIELSSKAKLVYFYFIRLTGNSVSVYPAHKTTAKSCSLSIAGARAAIDELEANSLIVREAQFRADNGQRANLYTLIGPYHDTPDKPTGKAYDGQGGIFKEVRGEREYVTDTEREIEETSDGVNAENTANIEFSPTNSNPLSHIIATTPAISRLSELINIMINNDIKRLIVKEKESKKILKYIPVCGASWHGYISRFIHRAREPTVIPCNPSSPNGYLILENLSANFSLYIISVILFFKAPTFYC